MTYKTHLIGGAQAGLLMAYLHAGTVTESAVIIGTSMLGSVLPDIDNPRSRIAKGDWLMSVLSQLLTGFTHHRGFLHTVPGAMLFGALFFALSVLNNAAESLYALLAALAAFIIMHLSGKASRRYGLAAAIAAYMGAPYLIDMLRGIEVDFTLNGQVGLMCACGIFAGCIMHMMYDTFNKSGISWLYPFSRKRLKISEIKTNTAGEQLFAGIQLLFLTGGIVLVCRDMEAAYVIRELVRELSVAALGAVEALL